MISGVGRTLYEVRGTIHKAQEDGRCTSVTWPRVGVWRGCGKLVDTLLRPHRPQGSSYPSNHRIEKGGTEMVHRKDGHAVAGYARLAT